MRFEQDRVKHEDIEQNHVTCSLLVTEFSRSLNIFFGPQHPTCQLYSCLLNLILLYLDSRMIYSTVISFSALGIPS